MGWNAGYVTDVNYTFGYYTDFNPVRTVFALTSAGVKAPSIRNACELGFGQGLSIAMHAAAQPGVQWWGTDFNPTQAGFAQDLATQSGSSARVYDQAFAEFCARDDLPEFEFIALHGIWTWVSDENRDVIVDFVRRKLAVGGALYISYNVLPGWATLASVRHILKQYSDLMGAPSVKMTQRVDDAFAFLDQLMAVQPAYGRANPNLAERYAKLRGMDRAYLVHEYLNRDWRPMYFSEVAEWLEPAKLSYVAPANTLYQQETVNLLPEQIQLVAAQTDPVFRETVRDFTTAQQFRCDLWVRGPRVMSTLEQAEALRRFRFVLITPRADVKLTLNGLQGEVTLHESVYAPLLDILANHDIKTFAEIETAARPFNINLPQVAAALAVLVGAEIVAIAQDEKLAARAKPTTDRLNAVLVHRSRSWSEISYLVSPVTGGGVLVDRFEQLFLSMRAQGRKTPTDWARGVYDILASQGQHLLRSGEALTTPEDMTAELTRLAIAFEKRLPILRGVGIA